MEKPTLELTDPEGAEVIRLLDWFKRLGAEAVESAEKQLAQRRRESESKDGGEEQMSSQEVERYPIKCVRCGRKDTMPFKPDPARPVYCHDCHLLILDERRARLARYE
jgi:CxxC-x17-CxxC domain-containing protein